MILLVVSISEQMQAGKPAPTETIRVLKELQESDKDIKEKE